MLPAPNQLYRIADIEIDRARGALRRAGRELPLREQSLQVLLYLIEHRERRVTKEELIENVWRGTAVTDDALVQCIKDIRRALGDDYQRPRFIKTVPKVGYRFIGELEQVETVPEMSVTTEENTTVQIEFQQGFSWKTLLAAALVILLLAGVSVYLYLRNKEARAETTAADAALPQVPGKRAVAVMYFENQSQSPELDWLREGLTDMLITSLSRSRNLTVLGRQQLHALLERMEYQPGERIKLETAREVARRTRAEIILLGRFARFGEKVRVEVELYDANQAQPLLSESLDADRLEQIPLQVDVLATKIATRLGSTPAEQAHASNLSSVMTDNLEAYRYYSLGVEKSQALHNAEAIELLKKAVELDPQFAMAYARIGYALGVTWNRLDEAKPYLEKAFSLSDRLAEKDRLLISAWYSIVNRDFTSAISAYRKVIAGYPLEVESYFRLAFLLEGEALYEEAIDTFKQGLVVDPEYKEIYNYLGGLYTALGRHDEALAMRGRYVQLAPSEPNAHDSLGISLQWAGRYAEAVAAYRQALALKPDFEVARIHLANTYYQMGMYREAISNFERYIQDAPSDQERARGYFGIGYIYWKMGDHRRAERAAAREVALNPEKRPALPAHIDADRGDLRGAEKLLESYEKAPINRRGSRHSLRYLHYLKGLVALRSGRAEEAILSFREAVKHLPAIWNLDAEEDCLANAYLELGRYDEAIAEYERILRLNPNYPLARYHLAQAYEKKGLRDQALVEYGHFLQIWKDADPDIPQLVRARRIVRDSAQLTSHRS